MTTCGEALLDLLKDYGVDTVFGIPGNHTVELYRGFGRRGIRHVTTRHEQGAGFMADGYARATGRPGVCVLISGPGLLNAATAIAQARADSVPMLVISGVAPRAQLGMQHGTLHELPDQRATAEGLCRWSHTVLDPDNLPELLHRAFTTFHCTRPGPVHLEIPLDLMAAPCRRAPAARPLPSPPGPDPEMLDAAAARLRRARQPLLLVGGGAVAAADPVCAVAERLDAPVLNTVNGKGICPAGHPLAAGGSPSLPALQQALADADAILAVGTEFGETDYDLLMSGAPDPGPGLIRMDIDALALTSNVSAELALVCDARAGLSALLARLDGSAADAAGAATADSPGARRARALRDAVAAETHFHPEMAAFFATLQEAVPDAVVVGDSTRPTYYAAWQYECPAPRRYFHSVSGFGTLGYAIPAALGARLGQPGPVLALIGDGGAQFSWPELQTGAEQRLPVAVIVWRNDGYEEIANSMAGAGVDTSSTRISSPELGAAAAAHGCGYRRADTHAELARALREAVAAEVPSIIEVRQSDFLTMPSGTWYS